MKFSDIREEDWARWEPWLDTCLLPLTGLNGTELPWEVTQSLEKLRDIMDLVEIPFKGRMVTYPAIHFRPGEGRDREYVESICRRLKTRFKYVVLITHDIELSRVDFGEADLFVSPSEDMDASELKRAAAESIQKMWSEKSPQ